MQTSQLTHREKGRTVVSTMTVVLPYPRLWYQGRVEEVYGFPTGRQYSVQVRLGRVYAFGVSSSPPDFRYYTGDYPNELLSEWTTI